MSPREGGNQGIHKKVKNQKTREPLQRHYAEEDEHQGKKGESVLHFVHREGWRVLLRSHILVIIGHIDPFPLLSHLSLGIVVAPGDAAQAPLEVVTGNDATPREIVAHRITI